MKCGGIFFIAFQERFKSSASQTSLALTIQNMTLSITGMFNKNHSLPAISVAFFFVLELLNV